MHRMSRFRVFLLWALMLAFPFQGYAAASMAFCATGPADAVAVAAAVPGGSHDHAAHHHAENVESAAQAQPDSAAHHAVAEPASTHKCGTCGTGGACHAIALIDTLPAVACLAVSQAGPAVTGDALPSVAPRVPDKPPRA